MSIIQGYQEQKLRWTVKSQHQDLVTGLFLQILMHIFTISTFFPKVTLHNNPQLVEHCHDYYHLPKSYCHSV